MTSIIIKHTASSLILVLILTSIAISGIQTEELQPNEGLFAWISIAEPYHLALRDALLTEHGYLRCQVLAIPSFERERTVYLVRDDNSHAKVVTKTMKTPLWGEY